MHNFNILCTLLLLQGALCSIVWNGNFNEFSTTSDLDKWSWSNQVGPYQTYIYGNLLSTNKISTWARLDASYKNPADTVATKGVQIHTNATSLWNGGNLWRCEFIPNYDQNTVQKGNLYFIWSMKHDSSYPLNSNNEHQLVFFESHYADLKYGGSGGANLWFTVNGQTKYSVAFPTNTWLTFALNVDYTNKKVAFYTINTATNTATQVVAPTSTSVDTNQWHIGTLRLADSSNQQNPTPEIIYYSSISLQTDLNNLPFGGKSSTTGSAVTTTPSTTGQLMTTGSASTSGKSTTGAATTGKSTTTGSTTGSAANTGFYTKGNKIYDSNGNVVVFKGIARPSLEWNSQGQYMSLSDYQLMKSWGANIVRLSLSQCFWLSGHAGYDSSYATTVDNQVKLIKSLGMAVILDLHWSDKGDMNGQCGQQTMADYNSVPFWTQLSSKYKNDPSIIFELYNEPHDTTWSVWKNGGDAGGFQSPGMQNLYNTVRATGANNLVIIGGLNYAYDLSGIASYPISGFNIIYNTHPYDFGGKQPSDWQTGFGYLAPTYPLIATEFGDFSCNSNSYYNQFLAYATQLGMSWTAWGWYVQGCSFPSLINDWNGTPSASGTVIKQYLASSTGSGTGTGTGTGTTGTGTGTGSTSGSVAGTTYQVYTDMVNSPWMDYSWATTKNPSDTSVKHSGTASYSFVPTNYQAVYFYCAGCIDTTKHASIEFYINGGTSGNQIIHFNIVKLSGSASVKYGPDNAISDYLNAPIPANTWSRVSVDLTKFPTDVYDGFWFQDQSGTVQGTVYIDDVTVYAISTSTTGTTGGTGGSCETVVLSTMPKVITASGSFNVTIGYLAAAPRDIVVDLMDTNSNWYGKGVVTVPAGKGVAVLAVKVQNNPSMNGSYLLHAWSVDQGTSNNANAWNYAYDNDSRSLSVGNSLQY